MLKQNIEKDLQDAKAIVQALEQQLDTKKASTMFRCVGCKGTHKISSCDAYEPLHYNNGAYEEGWCSDGELWAVCPKTGVANRFLFNDNYDLRKERKVAGYAFFLAYNNKFKSVTTTMRRSTRGDEHDIRWINNYYIDKNRKKFGLPDNTKRCNC